MAVSVAVLYQGPPGAQPVSGGKNLGDIVPVCKGHCHPVLDLRWCLLCVLRTGDPFLNASSPALRSGFTPILTPVGLLMASILVKIFWNKCLHPQALIKFKYDKNFQCICCEALQPLQWGYWYLCLRVTLKPVHFLLISDEVIALHLENL